MVNVDVVNCTVKPFSMNEVDKGLEITKNGKTSGPTGIVKKHLAASPYGKKVVGPYNSEVEHKANYLKLLGSISREPTISNYFTV